jgi:transposase
MSARKSATKVDPAEMMKAFLEVRGGTLTATDAAQRLGISRKTYYEWEARAIQALMNALQPKEPGRPPQIKDPETERLRTENQRLAQQVQVLEQTLTIRRLLSESDTRAQKK